ncbi:RING finger protein 10 [Eupeodes corollae]|uniref:RING finger protein 10 n=1 Tax=Eupeodes corollae TaxID=290404 RepID=UPI00249376E2|nr:RING finger protein 10 [Eupeodes corollae]
MDKKQQQQYSRQGSSKALSSDSRKSSSELYSNKPWPKNSRRRENPNCPASKNDSQRGIKVGPAKTRPNVDKRPKARSGPNSSYGLAAGNSAFEDVSSAGAGLATEEEIDVELMGNNSIAQHEYELNSVYAAGSKKQNLNHLLNFHYGPREFDNYSGLNMFGKNANNNRSQVKKQKYNKEQYLQANFQFVVNWKATQKVISSPDTLIDWDLIEQINIQTTEEPQCPICLYPPLAAKLTRCGHVYCWPCILHYLALSDKTWRKCPICYEAVHTNDLKSTTIVQQVNFSVGNYISFQLMQRKKGSLSIEKFTNSNAIVSDDEGLHNMYSSGSDESKFAKFLVANRSDVISIIEREQNELAFCESEQNCPEFVFVQQALDLLKSRKSEINNEIETIMEKKIASKKEKDNTSLLREKSDTNIGDNETKLSKPVDEELNAKYYYFYQSVDGQNIFLHPLNVKMLQACYGSLDQAPLLVNAKILQKEHHSMDEDHRRKFTCLGHLPLTCHFEVVEVELETPIVSEEVLNVFKGDIIQRKKARLRRDREEKKREIKINAINDRQMGKLLSSTANINLSSSHEFPTCGFEETLDGSSNQLSTDAINIPTQPSSSKRSTYSSIANSNDSPIADFWPTMGACSPRIAKDSTWVREATIPRQRMTSERYSESDSLNEEFHPAPNLGDVLAEAISQKHNTPNKNESKSGNSKKSKKNKKMLVFSTGMNFGGK